MNNSTSLAFPDEAAAALIVDLQQRVQVKETLYEGACIRWRRMGSGPDLLLVHGGQGSWLHWVHNMDTLAAAFTLWMPDLPGLGESDEIAEPITLDRLVAALQTGLDTLVDPGREIGVAAFSFGATLAAHLAVRRGHITRFAMIGGTGHGLPRRSVDQKKWRDLPPGPLQDEAHRYNLSQQMLHDPACVDALALRIHREAMLRTRLRSRPISRSAATREALDRLECPILMAWGGQDPTARGEETAHALADEHANRKWVVVPDAGHWLLYERPDVVNPLLLRWFAGSAKSERLNSST